MARHRGGPGSPERTDRAHCILGEVETELHFLTACENYQEVRDYPKVTTICLEFETFNDHLKLPY